MQSGTAYLLLHPMRGLETTYQFGELKDSIINAPAVAMGNSIQRERRRETEEAINQNRFVSPPDGG